MARYSRHLTVLRQRKRLHHLAKKITAGCNLYISLPPVLNPIRMVHKSNGTVRNLFHSPDFSPGGSQIPGLSFRSCRPQPLWRTAWALVALILAFHFSYGQEPFHGGANTRTRDIFLKLDIHQDPDMMDLVNLHIRRNLQGGQAQGYRIEIFFSSDLDARHRAQKHKTDFLTSYPGYNVYVTYVSPDFKVRVGDFRTRNEALRFMKEIQGQFPRAFVVPDLIELPKAQ